MPIASWLFIRGSESIWVERPSGNTLIIAGPGHRRQQRTFFTEEQLQRIPDATGRKTRRAAMVSLGLQRRSPKARRDEGADRAGTGGCALRKSLARRRAR